MNIYGIIFFLGCIVFGCSVSNGFQPVAIVFVTLMKIELNGYMMHIKYSVHSCMLYAKIVEDGDTRRWGSGEEARAAQLWLYIE